MKKYLIILGLCISVALQGQGVLSGVVAGKQSASSTLLNDIVAYWKFDETEGTTGNDEVGTNDLSYTSVTVNQAGILGKSVLFNNASANAVPAAYYSAGKSELTISMWVYSSETDIGGVFGEINTTYYQFVANATVWATRDASTGTTGARNNDLALPAITANTWTHIVFVYSASGGFKRIYKNAGASPAENTTSVDQLTSDRTASSVGREPSDPVRYVGQMDELGIWDRALTYDEIVELYNSGAGKTYPF